VKNIERAKQFQRGLWESAGREWKDSEFDNRWIFRPFGTDYDFWYQKGLVPVDFCALCGEDDLNKISGHISNPHSMYSVKIKICDECAKTKGYPAGKERDIRASTVPFTSGHSRAQWVMFLLIAGIVLDLISAVSTLSQIGLITKVMAGGTITRAEVVANDTRQQIMGILNLLAYITTVVLFLMWLYRAHRNLPALGTQNLRFSPGWAVGYWFIPIVNIFKPYQVLKEIWKASDPSVDLSETSSWKNAPTSHLLGWWWAFFLISNYLSLAVFKKSLSTKINPTLSGILEFSWFMIASETTVIVAAILVIFVVRTIDKRQEEKKNRIAVVDTSIGTKEKAQMKIVDPLPSPSVIDLQKGTPPSSADNPLLIGATLAQKGLLDEAIKEYCEPLRQEPDYAETHYNLGNALIQKGLLDEAIKEFRTALRLKPDYAEAYSNLGVALYKKGLLDEAIAEYREAIRLKSSCPETHCGLGLVLTKKGFLDEAIKECREAIRLKPDYAGAHYNLGLALALKGFLHEAIYSFENFLRYAPPTDERREIAKEVIKTLKK
jgi:tetratricopeptide (TPR) repeat protein